MNNSLKTMRIKSMEEFKNIPGIPSEKRLAKGPVAYIECAEEIPCNPCQYACAQGAIVIGDDIFALPVLEEEKCIGCGSCIAKCPGMAIFVIDRDYTAGTAAVSFPYEFLPLPEAGDEVSCAGRKGEFITKGKVIKTEMSCENDKTAVITVEVPKEHCQTVRTLVRRR